MILWKNDNSGYTYSYHIICLHMDPLQLPKLTKYVNDLSGILSSSEIETLSKLFVEHETRTTEQVTTLLFPHRQGHELLEIWLKVFNENGIGQKNLNNGLLLIIATEEKKIRIVVWKGLELKYTEMVCRDIIENTLRPLLNSGNYEDLIRAWHAIVSGKREVTRKSTNNIWKVVGIFIANLVAIGTILLFFLSGETALNFLLATKTGLVLWVVAWYALSLVFFIFLRFIFTLFGRREVWMRKKWWFVALSTLVIWWFFFALWKVSHIDCNEIYRDQDKVSTSCARILLWKKFEYTDTEYTASYKAAHPEQFRKSSSSSNGWSSSSFDWGGGSSNGGGYGD